MSAIIRPLFHNSIADSIYENVQNRTTNIYYYLGKILAWDTPATPETPTNTLEYENDVRQNMVSMKRIDISDVSFIVERNDWESGTVYNMFDDTVADLTNFYVLTEDFNIYKCIYNNEGGQSTTQPTGTDTAYLETADGYVWKFMGFIPLSLRNKFLTSAYMPVTKSIKNSYYSNGEIESVTILNGGENYDSEAIITVTGDGTGADLEPVITAGEITGVTINDAGEGYTNATITVTVGPGDPGTGANITANLSSGDLNTQQANVELVATDGALSWILITNAGTGYGASSTVTITGDGTGAAASITVNVDGEVTGIEITNYGSGYSYADVTINDSGEDGSGFTARAIVSPQNGHGFDAIKELKADILCFYTSFEDELNQSMNVDNEFRQVGLIQNPEQYGNTYRYTGQNGSACFKLAVSAGGITSANFPDDATLTNDTTEETYRIVATEDSAILVQTISGAAPVTGTYSYDGTSATVTGITNPDINKFSGQIMYIDNRTAFIPTEEQFVIFRSFFQL